MNSPYWPQRELRAPEGISTGGGGIAGPAGVSGLSVNVPLVTRPVWSQDAQRFYGVYKQGDEYQFYRAATQDAFRSGGPENAEWVASIKVSDITRELGAYRVRINTNSPLHGHGIPNHVPVGVINELYPVTLRMQTGSGYGNGSGVY